MPNPSSVAPELPLPPRVDDAGQHLTIVGAGLAGALLATLLAQRGWSVDVYEKRGDLRELGYERGRSINLALAERGRHALRQADADDAVMAKTVMMRGRMVHFADGHLDLQRYGRDDSEVIWSVHRGELNEVLLNIAEQAGARIHFHHRLDSVDFDARIARFGDDRNDTVREIHFETLVGADGAGSSLRQAMAGVCELDERSEFLGHSYKELEIPPGPDGGFQIEPHALHIWPRGRYMCIALPNDEGTFTVTLFLPNHAVPDDGSGNQRPHPAPGFDTITNGAQARAFFDRDFPDASKLIPALEHDFDHNPTGVLGTLYLDRWHLDHRAVLIGDAAHAMVPFHGQGMNCAFEDCVALAHHLLQTTDRNEAFAGFQAERLPNARAIQQMALENYLEMRDHVDDEDYLLQRELGNRLAERHPTRFLPRYSMVTFTHMPYAIALERGDIQRQLLVELTHDRTTLDGFDWDAADALVEARLPPLPENI
nr:NAD(P)/FAD-dependent oxidoreductase [Lysobacter antarcticus]